MAIGMAEKTALPVNSTVRNQRNASHALLDGAVFPTLVRLAAPTIALMTLQGLISAGETAFVGQLGASALAGASLSFPLVMLMTTLSAGAYGGGVSSAVARALGAGRQTDANRLALTALSMAGLIGLVFMSVMLLLGRSIYQALGATGSALDCAVLYSNVLFLGAVPFWLFNAAASILRAGGNANLPATTGAIGGVMTLAVSPVLIFGIGSLPGLGIAGAASAIVLYNIGMALVLLRSVSRVLSAARPAAIMQMPLWTDVYEILKVSIPSAASTILTNMTFIVLTGLVAPFSESAIAGYGSGGRLEYLLIPIVFGIGSALVPLVAASEGAGNFSRVQQLTRTGAVLATVACAVIGITVATFPLVWMNLFTTDSDVVAIGSAYLVRVGYAYPCLGLGLSLYFASQGRGRTGLPLLATGTRLIVAGFGGIIAVRTFRASIETLFHLMAGGLAMYAMIMVIIMRRELGWSPETLLKPLAISLAKPKIEDLPYIAIVAQVEDD